MKFGPLPLFSLPARTSGLTTTSVLPRTLLLCMSIMDCMTEQTNGSIETLPQVFVNNVVSKHWQSARLQRAQQSHTRPSLEQDSVSFYRLQRSENAHKVKSPTCQILPFHRS